MDLSDDLRRQLTDLRDRAAIELAGKTFAAIDELADQVKKSFIRSIVGATQTERKNSRPCPRPATRQPR